MKKSKSILFLCLGVLFLAADQLTKLLAVRYLKGTPGISVIPGVFEFYYLENTGAAFGMFAQIQTVFVAAALLIILLCLYVFFRMPPLAGYVPLRVLCMVLAAGAAGNMLDRLLYGYVIDFLYISLIDFPVFNLADCYICAGAAVFVLLLFTYYREESFSFLIPGHRPKKGSGEGKEDRLHERR